MGFQSLYYCETKTTASFSLLHLSLCCSIHWGCYASCWVSFSSDRTVWGYVIVHFVCLVLPPVWWFGGWQLIQPLLVKFSESNRVLYLIWKIIPYCWNEFKPYATVLHVNCFRDTDNVYYKLYPFLQRDHINRLDYSDAMLSILLWSYFVTNLCITNLIVSRRWLENKCTKWFCGEIPNKRVSCWVDDGLMCQCGYCQLAGTLHYNDVGQPFVTVTPCITFNLHHCDTYIWGLNMEWRNIMLWKVGMKSVRMNVNLSGYVNR